MFSGKRNGVRQRARSGNFLRRRNGGAVRYFAESLERRVVLSGVLYDSPQPIMSEDEQSVASETDTIVLADARSPEQEAYLTRLSSHTLTADDMRQHNIAEVEWRGRAIYARPGEWIVDLDLSATSQSAPELLNDLGLGPIFRKTLGRDDMALVGLRDDQSGESLVAAFDGRRVLESVDPNGIGWAMATPNDSSYASQQYALNNTGQNSGIPDADIDAPEAWDLKKEGTGVVVGVIDTGVNYKHADLYKNIWINQAEIPSARRSNLTDIDSDGLITFWDLNNTANQGTGKITDQNGNSLIDGGDLLATYNSNGTGGWANNTDEDSNTHEDDLIGWNFSGAYAVEDPLDTVSHGTHVAGTIGAMGNNSTGAAGVVWKTQIMPIRLMDDGEDYADSELIECIVYATALKTRDTNPVNIRVLNGSFGEATNSLALREAIDDAGDAGILYVAAAGNFARSNDALPNYPSSLDADNIISVASTDRYDHMFAFRDDNGFYGSSYGLNSVDLGAPGTDIYSTVLGNSYGLKTGTSFAAPHVAGVAALAFLYNTSATVAEVKAALMWGTDWNSSLQGITVTGGRLNAHNTLKLIRAPITPIDGTDNADTISVQMSGSNVQVIVNSVQQYSGAASGVSWIRLNAKGGNDSVTINSAVTIPVMVDAGAGTDAVSGGGGDDRILNAEGTISGGAGNDHISAGTGNDTLIGDAGSDTLVGGAGDDVLYGDDSVSGGTGDDVLIGMGGADDFTGHGGNDSYVPLIPNAKSDGAVDVIFESASTSSGGTDTIDLRCGYLADLEPLNAIPVLHLWTAGNRTGGVDAIDIANDVNGKGGVHLKIDHSNLSTTDNTAIENAIGWLGFDNIEGNSLGNKLWGVGDNDTLNGLAGNDSLFGGNGNDNLFGAGGLDALNGDAGTDGLQGGDGNDVLNGGADTDQLRGGDGNDVLNGNDGADSLEIDIAESNGNDTLNGGNDDDTLYSGNGDNTLNGNAGADTMNARTVADGFDWFLGGADSDTANYSERTAPLAVSVDGAGDDGQADVDAGTLGNQSEGDTVWYDVETVIGSQYADGLSANSNNVTLQGGAGNDTLRGGSGDDRLEGGTGDDSIIGGLGNDELRGENDNDVIFGDSEDPESTTGGNDVIRGGAGNDSCYGGYGDDEITGGANADMLYGNADNDSFFDNDDSAVDWLNGGDGWNDTALSSERDTSDILVSIEVT